MKYAWLFVLVVAVSATLIRADDWPQFQGPRRDGVSLETGLANTWPAAGPTLLWTNEKLGSGYGGAIVDKGEVYLLDRVGDKQDVLRCLSLQNGQESWSYAFDAPLKYKGGYNGSRNLPAVDEQNVYIIGPLGDVKCISKKTHQPVWEKNLVKDYGATISNWGFCQSPVIYKNLLVAAPLTAKVGAVAYDKATGNVAWESPALGDITWTNPCVMTLAGVDQIIILATRGQPKLSGLDVAAGKILWQYKAWKCPNTIASPIPAGEDQIFITGGYNAGCALVKINHAVDAWTAAEIFQNRNLSSQAQNPIYYKGYIYANSAANKNGMTCIDLKGELKWHTSNTNEEDVGNILIADDKIYSIDSDAGAVKMLAASPEGYKELGNVGLGKAGEIWAPLALSDGKLLVRQRNQLKCFDVKNPGSVNAPAPTTAP